MKPEEIVTDAELVKASGNANFGSQQPRNVIKFVLLQYVCGYHSGGTAQAICNDLALVRNSRNSRRAPSLTKKGKDYLWACFGKESY